MGKKVSRENHRVVVEPARLGNFGFASVPDRRVSKDEEDRQRQYRSRCEDIAKDIRRHVDTIGSVSVESDEVAICEHCGSHWTEDSNTYNGGCCDKDEGAHDAEQEAVQQMAYEEATK